ncbi:MAG: NAD-dependent protein deacylase [Gammaproteobacteria bacterium]|nr:NAD-dependent protein deacylase [Gammaproteobacteria bacterium]
MRDDLVPAVERVAARLRGARRVAVLTGAGMSVASGLPTYRGIGGLYNDMVVDEGMPIEEILHAYTFARNPALTWKYIAQIERACRGAVANEGHHVLARWDARFDVRVVTQNVDGFHRAAGSRHVIELHGNLGELKCIDCERQYTLGELEPLALPPRCLHCDGLIRPNVVLFGEMLPSAALDDFDTELRRGFDVMFSIGTSAGFPYIQQPVIEAARRGTYTVEINPDGTLLSSSVAEHLACPALYALQAIDAALAVG